MEIKIYGAFGLWRAEYRPYMIHKTFGENLCQVMKARSKRRAVIIKQNCGLIRLLSPRDTYIFFNRWVFRSWEHLEETNGAKNTAPRQKRQMALFRLNCA